ncbi:MAG: hypothetical protein AB7L13_16925 [Acidimicrobiia bacterium]
MYDELVDIDVDLAERANQRREHLAAMNAAHYELWPTVPGVWGRRPRRPGEPPLAPIATSPDPVNGARLRYVCRCIVHRFGEVTLPDLHSLVHLYGYVIASNHPTKALADAMGEEADTGRLVRVRRGTYGWPPEATPEPGTETVWALGDDPSRWYRDDTGPSGIDYRLTHRPRLPPPEELTGEPIRTDQDGEGK